jgi:hypothetical protein
MIIYGGVKYIAQPGNTAARSDALDIIKNCIWGIALLAGAFLILNTINTSLVNLRNPDLRSVEIPGDQQFEEGQQDDTSSGGLPGNTSNACTVDTGNTKGRVDRAAVAALAKKVLSTKGILLESSGTCGSATSPYSIMQTVAGGGIPPVCDSITQDKCQKDGCPQGGSSGSVTLCPQLLEGIIKAQEMVNNGEMPPFKINSLTGGIHTSTSPHYKGMKMDVLAANDTSAPVWEKIKQGLNKVFGKANCEYSIPGGAQTYRPCLEINREGAAGKHIDVEAGGAGSPSLNDVAKYGDTVTKLAAEYSKLNPRLRENSSYGIPPTSGEKACGTPGVDPFSIIKAVADGKPPVVCDDSQMDLNPDRDGGQYAYCKCSVGGRTGNKTLGDKLLQLLIDMENAKKAGQIPDFMVVALTGGIQKWEGESSNHYSGKAFDIIPMAGSGISRVRDDWQKLADFVEKKNYDVRYEYLRIEDEYPKYYELKTSDSDKGVLFSYDKGNSSGQSTRIVQTVVTCSDMVSNFSGGNNPLTTLTSLQGLSDGLCLDARIHVNAY